jgi:tRNA threonylcarbamoyl adenosine modification protein YeaZ
VREGSDVREAPRWLLALDTATNTIVVAAGSPDGRLLGLEAFEGRYRHSQELLPAIARLVERLGLRLNGLDGIVVGTGPGVFTGLRVGLATAKTLAHELTVSVVGIPTSDALLAGAAAGTVLWLPYGPRDRVAIETGQAPAVVREGTERTPAPTDVAIDLEGRAPVATLERGRGVLERLPDALLRLGAARLAAGEHDDPERLVPRYASPPRGLPAEHHEEGVAWSRDPR